MEIALESDPPQGFYKVETDKGTKTIEGKINEESQIREYLESLGYEVYSIIWDGEIF